MRLAAKRGRQDHWDEMARVLAQAEEPGATNDDLMKIDRRCHEIVWDAAGNRFLTATLDMMYAQSDRLWHLYIADVADMKHAVQEHGEMFERLAAGDGDAAAELCEKHVRGFDDEMNQAVRKRLGSPLPK
jgi:DNA-binding FadR family transcriptional regulator